MSAAMIRSERRGQVALVRLASDNPLNPLTDALMDQLIDVLLRNEADPQIHAIVLTGSDKAFAAGADIVAMSKLDYASAFSDDYIGRSWDRIRMARKPIIAAVGGYALGGGCELAMMCDIVIAADDALFGQPEIKLGIVPGAGGTQRLPRAVGKSTAMLACLTGESFNASEALAYGLVSMVVARERLIDEAMRVGEQIARHSLPVIVAIKEAVNRAFESSLSEGLLFERRLFHAGFALADQKEGMAAFLERRQAAFQNR
ncbi:MULTISPECIES: enoyl-CoA hydratase-related protein [Caballeronia]|jgi:enoyl-CoA hydratase|uniref:enoyl-CoA hydratase-related protein n=1 Tax=Caballeronia TaxID=1827195 RepID=UPI00025BADC4|nr:MULTISPECIES: enoyl-CoA hydratase-related protein [Caballeronia]EKS71101.1 Enoyl-CoA hydratase/isomerase [Burkholderia sp. SJ98]MDR5769958.1 enoyl-CoA hydratase-related protein [Caballeronia sp. LZ028]